MAVFCQIHVPTAILRESLPCLCKASCISMNVATLGKAQMTQSKRYVQPVRNHEFVKLMSQARRQNFTTIHLGHSIWKLFIHQHQVNQFLASSRGNIFCSFSHTWARKSAFTVVVLKLTLKASHSSSKKKKVKTIPACWENKATCADHVTVMFILMPGLNNRYSSVHCELSPTDLFTEHSCAFQACRSDTPGPAGRREEPTSTSKQSRLHWKIHLIDGFHYILCTCKILTDFTDLSTRRPFQRQLRFEPVSAVTVPGSWEIMSHGLILFVIVRIKHV